MAQYKVPQDVEADDKLLGPFTFRQFIYLMVTGGCIGLAFGLFQIFPLLAIIPIPFAIFFGALALPIKRDQPMETYLAAILSYHLKPRKRIWNPGQRESTIEITAPKIVEKPRTRDLSGEEAGNRLSFLANVIDSEGYAVRGAINDAPVQPQIIEEANSAPDFFDSAASANINQLLAAQQNARHEDALNKMRQAISASEANNNPISYGSPMLQPLSNDQPLRDLANNRDYSVATLSKEAARIEGNN